MEAEDVKKLFLECIEFWGAPAQVLIAIEELAELQVALVKGLRCDPSASARAAIAEELADVKIMIQQIEVMYDLPDLYIYGDLKKGHFSKLVEDHRQRKLQRLRERLETDKAIR